MASSLCVLSASSQLSRFPQRLHPSLANFSGTLGELVTRAKHRNVSAVPYRVLLKAYVELRSRLKRELAQWETEALLSAAEVASLVEESSIARGSTVATADSFQRRLARVLAAEQVRRAGLGTISGRTQQQGFDEFAEAFRRIAAIDAIVAAADCEVDAVLLTSVFPHANWMQVRSPFGPQQTNLPMAQFLTADEVGVGSSSENGSGLTHAGRLSLLLAEVEADLDPATAVATEQKRRREAGFVGPFGSPHTAHARGAAHSGDNYAKPGGSGKNRAASSLALATVVAPDLLGNTDFLRFARNKNVGQRANHHGSASNSRGASTPPPPLVPFVVPFTTLHQLGAEVAERYGRHGGTTGHGAGADSLSSLSPGEALRLASVELEPAETLRTVLFERLQSSARTAGRAGASSGAGLRVEWAVMPPTTEFGLICGWRRNAVPTTAAAAAAAPATRLTPHGLGTVVSNATARAVFLAHGLSSLSSSSGGGSGGNGSHTEQQQVGILTGLRPRPLTDMCDIIGVGDGAASEGASTAVVGRLPTAALEAIAGGSVPAVEGAFGRAGLGGAAGEGEGPTMVVDNSLAGAETNAGRVHRDVAQKCGNLGRRLQM